MLLRLSADPLLPPIACPLSAVQQCGQLECLLELQREGEAEGEGPLAEGPGDAGATCSTGRGNPTDGRHQAQQRTLLLGGVRPEEHAALRQLVRCLAGQTHVGLLDAACCLDVVR